jgi:hypothetical protein
MKKSQMLLLHHLRHLSQRWKLMWLRLLMRLLPLLLELR